MKPQIAYLADDSIDEALDQELRGLLTICFTKPQDVVFRDRRYFREPYPHRWVIRDRDGAVVAHIGVHDKQVEAGRRVVPIGGMAEVCVHPGYRGRGYVRMMLAQVHEWLAGRAICFAVLFGNPCVYGSSGYRPVANLYGGGGEAGWKQVDAMVRALSDTPWPDGRVYLRGPTF